MNIGSYLILSFMAKKKKINKNLPYFEFSSWIKASAILSFFIWMKELHHCSPLLFVTGQVPCGRRAFELLSHTWQGGRQVLGQKWKCVQITVRSHFPPWLHGWACMCPVEVLVSPTVDVHRLCKQFLIIWLGACVLAS